MFAGAVNVAPLAGLVTLADGAAFGALTATFDSTAVERALTLWLVTARPTYAVAPNGSVCVVIVLHVVPSTDPYEVTVVPCRTSRTQTGAGAFGPAALDAVAPSLSRRRA